MDLHDVFLCLDVTIQTEVPDISSATSLILAWLLLAGVILGHPVVMLSHFGVILGHPGFILDHP